MPHGDNHDLWIDPDDPQRMIVGNDGGATSRSTAARPGRRMHNQPTAQFYRVTTDNRFPYWVYGAQQDNTQRRASRARVAGRRRSTSTDWHAVGGGESGWIAPNPNDPDVVYAGEYGGMITRYDHRTGQARDDHGLAAARRSGTAPKDLKYRFQWNAPIVISPHDPKTLYHAVADPAAQPRRGARPGRRSSPT